MKILKPIILLMVMALSGCGPHVGYQRSYIGYGGVYGGSSYYDYPYSSYYQTGPTVYYDRHYMQPRPSYPHDWNHRDYYNQGKSRPQHKRNDAPRWKPNVSGTRHDWNNKTDYRSRQFQHRPIESDSHRLQHRSNHGNVTRVDHGHGEAKHGKH